jgi:hypothetical protein
MNATWANIPEQTARQRFGKHVPAANNTQATIELFFGYNDKNGVFYVVLAEML